MQEIHVEIDESYIGDDENGRSNINAVVVTKWGRFSNFFPRSVSPEDVAKALDHKAAFLEEDLPIMMEPNQRNGILNAFRSAVNLVPGLKK